MRLLQISDFMIDWTLLEAAAVVEEAGGRSVAKWSVPTARGQIEAPKN